MKLKRSTRARLGREFVKGVMAGIGQNSLKRLGMFRNCCQKFLSAVAQSGQRAILLFCVNRDDATRVTIAEEIDPAYAKGLREARSAGVELLAYRAVASRHENTLCERLSFIFE